MKPPVNVQDLIALQATTTRASDVCAIILSRNQGRRDIAGLLQPRRLETSAAATLFSLYAEGEQKMMKGGFLSTEVF